MTDSEHVLPAAYLLSVVHGVGRRHPPRLGWAGIAEPRVVPTDGPARAQQPERTLKVATKGKEEQVDRVLTVELTPETEAALAAFADRVGQTAEEVAEEAVHQYLHRLA
ncbi:hypothetical protein ACWDYH_24820 [Nocardia goodfellowii]